MNEDYLNRLIAAANKRRVANAEKLRRRVELGYIKGKVHANGVVETNTPKGIQNWYDTRTLIKKVTEAFDRNEVSTGRRICYINGKWQLQIRGKHLRRLLKAMPNVKQVGRTLIEEK
jgi:glutamine cyclotransferase